MITWLASYPKSGNTWIRAFLSSYLRPGEEFCLNNLVGSPLCHYRPFCDEIWGVSSSECSPSELDFLMAKTLSWLGEQGESKYIKTHEQYRFLENGEPLFPTESTWRGVYIFRNPADVTLSLAHHQNWSFEQAVDFLLDDTATYASSAQGVSTYLPQKLGDWCSHVKGWTGKISAPLLVLQYEKLIEQPQVQFEKLVRFLELPWQDEHFERALARSEFTALQELEKVQGFRERRGSHPFFHKGEKGQGEALLSPRLLSKLRGALEFYQVLSRSE